MSRRPDVEEGDVDQLRHRLAQRIHDHPVAEWSPGLINALTALFDMYAADKREDRPATVPELVRSAHPQPG